MQEQLQKLAVSKQEVLHCLGIIGAGFLYSLGINLFVVPAGLYTGGIMGFAQLLRTLFLHVTGLELKIDIAEAIHERFDERRFSAAGPAGDPNDDHI